MSTVEELALEVEVQYEVGRFLDALGMAGLDDFAAKEVPDYSADVESSICIPGLLHSAQRFARSEQSYAAL